MFVSISTLAALATLRFLPTVSAGVDFSGSCANYYVGNGMADATPGELFIEAWCHGGATETGEERPSLCTKLNLSQCYKNNNGKLEPFPQEEKPNGDLSSTCDISSCAMRGDAWDGPILSCYCQDAAGNWDLAEVNLNHHVGNEGGFLSCGTVIGTKTCKYPWTTEDGVVQSELR